MIRRGLIPAAIVAALLASAASAQSIGGGSSIATPVSVANGGTGQASLTAGALIYGNGTSAAGALADITAGSCLLSNGSGSAPVWGSCVSGGGAGSFTTLTASTSITLSALSTAGALCNTSTGLFEACNSVAATFSTITASGGTSTLSGLKTGSIANSNTGHAFFTDTATAIGTAFTSSGTDAIVQNGSAAIVITLPGTGTIQNGSLTLGFATTGWVCSAQDRTTPAAVVTETGTTTTSASFNFSGGTNADVIQFSCQGY